MNINANKLNNLETFRGSEMWDITGLDILVGANGAGKSTLFSVFGFLKANPKLINL